MRQGPNPKRSRGRNNGRRPNMPSRMQTYDSNGPDVRIRGSAYQVHEKYLQLARDASSSGDRIMAESYFQHAEHYYRIIAAIQEQQGNDPNRRRPDGYGQDYRAQGGEDGGEGGEEYGDEPGEGQPRGEVQFRQHPPEEGQGDGYRGEDRQHADDGRHDGGHRNNGGDGRPDGNRGDRFRQGGQMNGDSHNGNRANAYQHGPEGQASRRERGPRRDRDPGMGPQPSIEEPASEA